MYKVKQFKSLGLVFINNDMVLGVDGNNNWLDAVNNSNVYDDDYVAILGERGYSEVDISTISPKMMVWVDGFAEAKVFAEIPINCNWKPTMFQLEFHKKEGV